jgi:hypothetical protein
MAEGTMWLTEGTGEVSQKGERKQAENKLEAGKERQVGMRCKRDAV